MKMIWNKIHIIFTVSVFVALASLDNAVVGLFPPLFSTVADDLKVHISSLGMVSAVNIFITAAASVYWAFLSVKIKRKTLILAGTVIWSVSVLFTAYSQNYIQLLLSQIIVGIGLGCISTIGYSVLSDIIPKNWRGMLLSLWGLSQGFGGIAGSVIASVMAPVTGWRAPFKALAVLGLIFMCFYFFIHEPERGASEPELKQLLEEGFEYNFFVKYEHLLQLIVKPSNLWLFVQGFFMNITTGTLIWLPTLYISKIKQLGYSYSTSIITAGYLYALLQAGGLFSMYFGYLGDKLQKRTYRGRALLAASATFAAIPLFILTFSLPVTNLNLPDTGNPLSILLMLLKQIVTNPWMTAMFLAAVAATAAQSANSPNWLALLTDVNLPEHRATAFSIANLINGAGRAIGNAMIGIVLGYVSLKAKEPDNYILTLTMFQIFFVPAVYCYIMASRNNGRDIRRIKSTILKRINNYKKRHSK